MNVSTAPFKNKTLLLFDVDGTLVQSADRADSRCFAAAYEHLYAKPFPSIDWHAYPHVTDTTILQTVIRQHFGRAASSQEIQHFEEDYIERLKQKRFQKPTDFFEIPGANALINRLLKEKEFLPVIATGGWIRPAHVKLQHIGIPSDQMIACGADGKTTREAIIQETLDLAYRHCDEFYKIVYIGDAAWDVAATRRLGMDFVGIRSDKDLDTLAALGATQVLPHFLDQEGFLEAVMRARPPIPEKTDF